MSGPHRPQPRRAPAPPSQRAGVDEELNLHLELAAEELEAEGMDPEEARAEARRRFGDLETTRRYCTTQREAIVRRTGVGARLDAFRQDLKLALRGLGRNPTYAAVVVATLAVAIAANTTLFSVMNPYLFRPLPYRDAERLVQVEQADRVTGWEYARLSLPQWADWRERSRSFEDLGAYVYGSRNLADEGIPLRVTLAAVTDNLFGVLGTEPALGRALAPGDGGPGGEDVVVLDHGFWRSRYGADPSVVGRTVRLNGVPHEVVGVMPPEFIFPWNEVKMWVPIRIDAATAPRDAESFIPVGRLRDGVTAEEARAELAGIQAELGRVHPDADGRFSGVSVRPLREALNFAWDVLRMGFLVSAAGVGFLLLIVCVNVAGLTLARAGAREREVAVRAAVGAGRGRIAGQLLTEALVLAALGGALGVLGAYLATRALDPVMPETLYRVGGVELDRRVLFFAGAVTLFTPFLFGLAPALGATRTDLTAALREGVRSGGGAPRLLGRRFLVTTQVALAVVLVTSAGLMIRSASRLGALDLGFQADGLLTVEVTPSSADYETGDALQGYYDRATDEVASLPGVKGAGTVSFLPMNHENSPVRYATPDTDLPQDQWPLALSSRAGAGYFEAMEIPLVAGRVFDGSEGPESDGLVVSRSLAERLWPGESPVGRTLLIPDGDTAVSGTVVGVVGDVQHMDVVTGPPRPHVYLPLHGQTARRRFLVVAGRGTSAELVAPVREALFRIDPDLPVTLRPFEEILRENTFQWSLGSLVLGVFGTVALLLAALGIYGVVSYSVSRRRHEMGVRFALGALPAQVRSMVVGEGLRLTAWGLGAGLVLSLAVGRGLQAMLFGVRFFDPPTFAAAVGLFATVAIGSSLLPALRAGRESPVVVLREE